MKNVIVILLIVGAAFGTWRYYKNSESAAPAAAEASSSPSARTGPLTEDQIPRMHEELESSLNTARQRGAYGLKQWLAAYGNSVRDPRLAWIQLDYVILVSQSNLGEARRVFDLVKKRVPETSVIYSRIKKMEPSYGTPRG
jgi:hypothetical protein